MVSCKLSFAAAVIASSAVLVTASSDSMPDIVERMANPSLIKVNTHLPSYQPAKFRGISIPKSRGSSQIRNHPRDFAPEDELNALERRTKIKAGHGFNRLSLPPVVTGGFNLHPPIMAIRDMPEDELNTLERRTKIKAGHGFNRLSIRPQGFTGGFNAHPPIRAIRDLPEDELDTLERRNKRVAGTGFSPMSIRPTGFAGARPRPRQPFMITARDMPEDELTTIERRNKRVAGHGFSSLSIRPAGFAGILPRPRQPLMITARDTPEDEFNVLERREVESRSLAQEILEELERRGLEFVEDDLD